MAGVALVTGGSRGIGAAVALELAERGSAVVVNYAADEASAAEVVQAVEARGGRAVGVRADVASSRDVRSLFDAAERQFGGVDVLVASAGVIATAQLAETSDEDFERQVAVNLRGTFNAFREAARRLRDGGRIVGVSSTTLALNAPGYGAYNATKGAVEGLVRVLAKELGGRGITVNAVAPDPVETDLFLRGKAGAEVARLAGLAPQGRIGRPSEVARVVGFLASAEAAWVNGQVVRVNGGIA